MGNNAGGGTRKVDEKQELSSNQLLQKLNDLSGNDRQSTSQSTISFHGINRYLNQQADKYPDEDLPQRKDHLLCAIRYKEVKELVMREDLGFNHAQREKILVDAYSRLNRNPNHISNFGALEVEGIVHPRKDDTIGGISGITSGKGISNNNNNSTHQHDPKLVERLDLLLSNPHSYLSLSEKNRNTLLELKSGELETVVKADEKFVEGTTKCWNLPGNEQQDTKRKVNEEYNAELCHRLTDAKETNRSPTEAFLSGKAPLLRAIDQGFDVFDQHSGLDKASTLKLFGETAQQVSLASNPVNTLLSGRVDTQFVQFDDPTGMTFKNDDVVRSNAKSMN